jgi:hypothetical protein
MYRNLLTAAVVAAFLAGCAPMDDKTADEAPAEKTHVTGSRIPVRDASQSSATVDAGDTKIMPNGGYIAPGNINLPPKGGGH